MSTRSSVEEALGSAAETPELAPRERLAVGAVACDGASALAGAVPLTVPVPDGDDLGAAIAVLSRAARQRLLAMAPRERVLALLSQAHRLREHEFCMRPSDLQTVLESFDGEARPDAGVVCDFANNAIELSDPDRRANLDTWLSGYPDLDAELTALAGRLYDDRFGIRHQPDALRALGGAGWEEIIRYREDAALRMSAAAPAASADEAHD